MGKIKKIVLGILLSCTAVCTSAAIAACSGKTDNFPDWRIPANYEQPQKPVVDGKDPNSDKFNGTYTINVKSAGGRALNGVAVAAKSGNETVVEGFSINGKVEFTVDAGVYDIVIDESTLPEGYYLPEGASYSTTADKASVDVAIPSRVIPYTASSGTSYRLGNVMYNFAFTATDGIKYELSDLVENYKAVMLNFWYVSCNPCRVEFPAIQAAYETYKNDIAIVALDYQDSDSAIAQFKEDFGLTFHMAYDSTGITNMFPISGFPTTVMIDRYGVVSYISSGTQPSESVWRAMFSNYVSNNYTQSGDTDDTDIETPAERTKPTPGLTMPDSEDIAQVMNGVGTDGKVGEYIPETSENDAEYSWPWIIGESDGVKYMTASNSMSPYSFATMYTSLSLKSGDAVSLSYKVDTELDNDILYILINRKIVAQFSGDSGGWKDATAIYIADHDVEVEFAVIYIKDQMKDDGTDTASLRNLNIKHISELGYESVDQAYPVADGLTLLNGEYMFNASVKYKDTIIEPSGDDIYYYVNYVDDNGITKKSLLLANITEVALWAEKHLGSDTFTTPANSSAKASLYLLSFWLLSNYESASETVPLQFDYGHSESVIQTYYLQSFSDNGYVPLTRERLSILKDFITMFYAQCGSLTLDDYYEDQWLEFCYIYKHYGKDHDDCFEVIDPIAGLSHENAFIAVEGTNTADITKILNFGDGGGIKFKFVPEKSGIYYIYSHPNADTKSGDDPCLYVYDWNEEVIASNDNDLRYDTFNNAQRDNFHLYVYLEKGQTYYLHTTMSFAQSTGCYDFTIEYAGDYVEYLKVCTTGEGMWTYDSYGTEIYIAIPVAFNKDTGIYHAVTDDYGYGSKIYIDFIHPNFFFSDNSTLEQAIAGGRFNFTSVGGRDYTQRMTELLLKSKEKDANDETYGMIEADSEIVESLNMLVRRVHGNGPEANAWLMFACYYEYYGTKA